MRSNIPANHTIDRIKAGSLLSPVRGCCQIRLTRFGPLVFHRAWNHWDVEPCTRNHVTNVVYNLKHEPLYLSIGCTKCQICAAYILCDHELHGPLIRCRLRRHYPCFVSIQVASQDISRVIPKPFHRDPGQAMLPSHVGRQNSQKITARNQRAQNSHSTRFICLMGENSSQNEPKL